MDREIQRSSNAGLLPDAEFPEFALNLPRKSVRQFKWAILGKSFKGVQQFHAQVFWKRIEFFLGRSLNFH